MIIIIIMVMFGESITLGYNYNSLELHHIKSNFEDVNERGYFLFLL